MAWLKKKIEKIKTIVIGILSLLAGLLGAILVFFSRKEKRIRGVRDVKKDNKRVSNSGREFLRTRKRYKKR